MNQVELQQKTLLLLLTAVSLAFVWVVWPFMSAVFWGTVLAILFAPLNRRMLVLVRRRRTLAALSTLLVGLVGVGIPLALITTALVRQGASLYANILSRKIDFGNYFEGVVNGLPAWVLDLLDRVGLGDVTAIQEKLSTGTLEASRFIATHALNIGQNTFEFVISLGVMLYLLFFLLRDGSRLAARIERAIPLSSDDRRELLRKFATVIRATVKGNVVMAATQGFLGGVMFWFLGIPSALLWGVLMALLSMLPAVGAAVLWGPIAIYFLFTGALWQGITLILFGIFVIGIVDNILRPLLVGKDTKMPDYLVLISTLGGIAIFGLNGFVIGPVIAAVFLVSWEMLASVRQQPTTPGT
jgi:predicted PurR-regulated permease PerM